MTTPKVDPTKGWVLLSNPVTPKVLTFGGPSANSPTTPHTEIVVQVTLSAQAHTDDVATVLEKLQDAIAEAQAATGGRIDVRLALPEILASS